MIETFCRRKDKTMIMVTHYQEELPACITNSLFLEAELKVLFQKVRSGQTEDDRLNDSALSLSGQAGVLD